MILEILDIRGQLPAGAGSFSAGKKCKLHIIVVSKGPEKNFNNEE